MNASSLSPYALFRSLRTELGAVYSPSEAAAVAEHYVCERLQLSRAQLLMDSPVALTAEKQSEIERDTQALREQVPVQYVLGYETFGSRRFAVSPDVLIPRPETYELVEWCASALSQQNPPRLLDVGTGSGCIAISLALELPHAQVEAWDISPRALTVARHNAAQLGAQVDFREVDLLQVIEEQVAEQREYDLIVSNRPIFPPEKRRQWPTTWCNTNRIPHSLYPTTTHYCSIAPWPSWPTSACIPKAHSSSKRIRTSPSQPPNSLPNTGSNPSKSATTPTIVHAW